MGRNCDFALRLMNLPAQAKGCTFDPFEACKPEDEGFFKLKPGCLPFGISCGWSVSVCTVEASTFDACLWFPLPITKGLCGTPIAADDLENLANFLDVARQAEDPDGALCLGQSVTIPSVTIRVNREWGRGKGRVGLYLDYHEDNGFLEYFLTDKQAALLSTGCRTAATLFRQYQNDLD